MFGIGWQELILILVIVLVLFGGKNIPELSRSLATAIKEFRKGLTDPVNDTSKENDKKTGEKTTNSGK